MSARRSEDGRGIYQGCYIDGSTSDVLLFYSPVSSVLLLVFTSSINSCMYFTLRCSISCTLNTLGGSPSTSDRTTKSTPNTSKISNPTHEDRRSEACYSIHIAQNLNTPVAKCRNENIYPARVYPQRPRRWFYIAPAPSIYKK